MKVVNYKLPRSSFLSVEKDLGVITEAMLKNKNLKKLLYYTTKNAMQRAPLSELESVELIGKNIKIIPEINKAVEYIGKNADNNITILTTYTALLKIDKIKEMKKCF